MTSTRDKMLHDAIEFAAKRFGDAMQFAHINTFLPKDFWRDPDTGELYPEDSVADEINAALAALETSPAPQTATGAAAPDSLGGLPPEPPASLRDTWGPGNVSMPVEEPSAELALGEHGTLARQPKPAAPAPAPAPATAPGDRERAAIRKSNAAEALNHARFELSRARSAWNTANDKLREAKAALARGNPNTITFEQNVRDYLASSQAERVRKAEGARQARMAPVDADRREYSGPNAAAYSRQVTGNRRGSYGRHMRGRTNFDPARGNVPKLPSER